MDLSVNLAVYLKCHMEILELSLAVAWKIYGDSRNHLIECEFFWLSIKKLQ